MQRVCDLQRHEVKKFEHDGIRPDCRHHQHLDGMEAIEMHHAGVFQFVNRPGPRRGYRVVQYTWAKKYRRTGLCHLLKGPGEPNMQLVRGAR